MDTQITVEPQRCLIALGEMDEVPEDIRRKLAENADAERSALDQLQDVLDARRSK